MDKSKNELVTRDQLGSKLKNVFAKNGLEFNQREHFFMMSIFDPNKSNHLNLDSVRRALFDEDIEAYFSRKDARPKGPFFENLGNENGLTKQQMRDLKRNEINDRRRVGRDRSILERCKVKLQKALLPKQMSHLAKWKHFDANRDGYVGMEDVKQRLMQMRVFSADELSCLMEKFRRSNFNNRTGQTPAKITIQHIPTGIGRFGRFRHQKPKRPRFVARLILDFQPFPTGPKTGIMQQNTTSGTAAIQTEQHRIE